MLLCASTALEVAWVSLQHARGVPSHFNTHTTFDFSLFVAGGVAIAVTVGIIRCCGSGLCRWPPWSGFTSGPNTFSNADDPAQVEFPIKQPTGAQLSTRVDRENLRLNQALADARKQAKDQAGTARTIAIVGLVVGVLGLGAAACGLTRKRA